MSSPFRSLILAALPALTAASVQAQVTCALLQPTQFSQYFAQGGTTWEKSGNSTKECEFRSNNSWVLKAFLYADIQGGGIAATQKSIEFRRFKADPTGPAATLLQQRYPNAWAGLRSDRTKGYGDNGEYFVNAHVYTFGNDKDAIMVRLEKPENFGPISAAEQEKLAQFGFDTMKKMAAQTR